MTALKILALLGAAFVLGLRALDAMEQYRRDLDGVEMEGDWLFDVVTPVHDNAGAA